MNLQDTPATNLAIFVLGVALVFFFIGVSVVLAVTGTAPTAMWAAGAAVSGALVGVLVPPPAGDSAGKTASTTAGSVAQEGAIEAAQKTAEQPADQPADRQAQVKEALQTVKDMAATIQATNLVQGTGVAPETAAPAAARNTFLMYRGLASAAAEEGQPQAKQDVFNAAAKGAENKQEPAANQGEQAGHAAREEDRLGKTVRVLIAVFILLLAVGIAMSFIHSDSDQLIKEADRMVLALASSAGGALIGILAPPSSRKPSSG